MNEKLNMQNFIAMLAERHGMSKKNADSFVKEFFQLIEEALETDKYVKIKGLGTFKLIDVESRESVNINTGERFEIQGHTKVSFTPESALKELINKPFSHFETVALSDDTILDDTPTDKEEEDNEKERLSKLEEKDVNQSEEIHQGVAPIYVSKEDETSQNDDNLENGDINVSHNYEKKEMKESVALLEDINPPSIVPPVSLKKVSDTSTMKYFIGIIVFVILLCGGAITFIYYPEIFDSLLSKRKSVQIANDVSDKHDNINKTSFVKDSIIAADDSISILGETQKTIAVVPESAIEKKDADVQVRQKENNNVPPIIPDSTNYKIVGTKTTYTIREGETLTKLALRFYGTKALWPYIVKYNLDIIKNPDNVPYGTVLRIPELLHK